MGWWWCVRGANRGDNKTRTSPKAGTARRKRVVWRREREREGPLRKYSGSGSCIGKGLAEGAHAQLTLSLSA